MKQKLALLVVLVVVAVPAVVWAPDALRSMREEDEGPGSAPTAPLAIGASLASVALLDSEDRRVDVALAAEGKVTVLWFWSARCPVVGASEVRVRALLALHDALRLIVVDPDPQDTRAEIERRRGELGSPYVVYRDPEGALATRLGIAAAAAVAVFDAAGVLRYRGALDDSLETPTVSYVTAAIDAILAGRDVLDVEGAEYGCTYPVTH